MNNKFKNEPDIEWKQYIYSCVINRLSKNIEEYEEFVYIFKNRFYGTANNRESIRFLDETIDKCIEDKNDLIKILNNNKIN